METIPKEIAFLPAAGAGKAFLRDGFLLFFNKIFKAECSREHVATTPPPLPLVDKREHFLEHPSTHPNLTYFLAVS